jgi:hypothetical protein
MASLRRRLIPSHSVAMVENYEIKTKPVYEKVVALFAAAGGTIPEFRRFPARPGENPSAKVQRRGANGRST